ncbi:helix-turn-helix domain-containing protein [Pedobacter frigidisoli]|uniref:helix-turn-helix domain-containing protein n=1 Tax=Pedobacter frigidisoli TaxID=2530455 RepID=UPI003977441B
MAYPPSSLKRNFKKKYGTTLFNYYRQLQMKLAFNYLSERKYTKGQVANILNFSNPSNFSIRYKKYLQDNSLCKNLIVSVDEEGKSYH